MGIALKLKNEGHEVRVWLPNDRFEFALVGLLDRSNHWRRDASDWADFVLSDMVGLGRHETTLAKFDTPNLGFNKVADVLELDRQRQMHTLRRFGVRLPESINFDTPDQAKDLAGLWTSSVQGFVLKPSGNIETGKTFVLKDKRLLNWALSQFSGDQEIVAQRYVEGVEVSTEGWFNGLDWVQPFNHTMEEKRFLNGDLGPNTGCMGNVVWPVLRPDLDVFVKELKKLTPMLKAMNYRGPIDLNAIANSEGVWALELTVRWGFDALEALYSLMEEPFGIFLSTLASGVADTMKLRQEFSTAIRLSVPPWPHDKPSKLERGMPILGLKPDDPSQFLTDVYSQRNIMLWSASDGVVAKVTGVGKTIKMSRRAAYRAAREVRTQGLQYRTDIGERVEADLKQLQKWKYI